MNRPLPLLPAALLLALVAGSAAAADSRPVLPPASAVLTYADLADLARQAGVNDAVVAQITAGRSAVDTVAMDEHNTSALSDTDSPGTPTVYDVRGRDVVDISDPDWLSALLRGA